MRRSFPWYLKDFVASEAEPSHSNTAGSKDCLLQAQRRSREHPLIFVAVCACVVKEMESTEECHAVTLDKHGMLRGEVTGRLKLLGPGEAVRAHSRG